MSIFNDVFVKKPGRSLFNLSHERKFTANFGYLYPILVMDAVPGDTFKMSTDFIVRASPLIAPIMHRVNVKINYFFVPNRLLWTHWQDFITGVAQEKNYVDVGDEYFVNPVKPYADFSKLFTARREYATDGSLLDFLGFPTMRPTDNIVNSNYNIDMLPVLAYNKIYVDWFRNQNVEGGYEGAHSYEGEIQVTDHLPYFQLRHRMWEKDYFTSSLPFAQRGDPVQIPISTGQSIKFDTVANGITRLVDKNGNQIHPYANQPKIDAITPDNSSDTIPAVKNASNSGYEQILIDNSDNLQISEGAIGTINDLRLATRIQRWLEKNARVGGRYIEQILAHFGVHSSDARLQRAEYLGGYTVPLLISDVEQKNSTQGTEVSGTDTPQGNLAGKGTALGQSAPIKCYCEEHGFIFGILSIVPKPAYQDGLPRMFKRSTRYDYYFPEFANLGEQEVTRDELYSYPGTSNISRERFGFQERYCEYKYIPSTVHGEFKGNLSFWHLGRQFANQPVLNKSFVTIPDDASINRVFAIEDSNVSDHFYVQLLNNVSALRPMPKQAIPTL